jgi:hypothetical protein
MQTWVLALVEIESYRIECHGVAGLPVCGIDRVNTCGATQCHHVTVEVQPLHTN